MAAALTTTTSPAGKEAGLQTPRNNHMKENIG
jgi:hypothetical protein